MFQAIYRSIPHLEADGAWHLSAMKKIVCYRVWDNRIFQFNAAKEFSTLFDRLLVADPPLSKEDAEWQIWLHEGGQVTPKLVHPRLTAWN